MLLKLVSALLLALWPSTSLGIVVRHDVPVSKYLVLTEQPGYLVDLPHEGHGVLISNRWIITVGHTIFYDYSGKPIVVGGTKNRISRVVFHPGYAQPSKDALSGDSGPLMAQLFDRDDLALMELEDPVTHLAPIPLYRGRDELGAVVEIYGKGATGDGKTGEITETKEQRTLRRCTNKINDVHDNWLVYVFDSPDTALPLEGMHGSGDSGGPSILRQNGQHYLAGLSSWQRGEGDLGDLRGGLYGAVAYQVRLSSYADWVDEVTAKPAEKDAHP